jgi:tRNA(Ile)-lysidine synthase
MASSKKLQDGELPTNLEVFLKKTVYHRQILLLGFSGGLDSCVLFDLLQRVQTAVGFRLQALHVNHGISPNAAEWERFCAEICAEADVPFQAARVSVPRDSGQGLEAAARAARYAVLLTQPVDAVVLAHHQDDQAETVLLQLLRGAGTKGLAAMPAMSESAEGRPILLRPLLGVSRGALEDYARSRDLRWIEDESNLDLAYDRNFLRQHILPELEKRFPACRVTLARSAAHLGESAILLDEVAREDAAHRVREGRLDLSGLRAFSMPRAKNLLRFWLAGHSSSMPSTRRLGEIYQQLMNARPDAQIRIPLTGGWVRRYRGEAWFEPQENGTAILEITWRGEGTLHLPGGCLTFSRQMGQGLSLARMASGRPIVRSRNGGERFRPDCRRPTRGLKHLFQEAGLPPWQRQSLPLLYLEEILVVVPGIGVACDFQASGDEMGLVVTWQPG